MDIVFKDIRAMLKIDGVDCLKKEGIVTELVELSFPDIPDAIAWHRANLTRLVEEEKKQEQGPE